MRRQTIQSVLVFQAVTEQHHHATAEEIYETIARDHPNIGRGTVYRNLQRLSEDGKIRKIEIPEGADRYDSVCRDHYHIRCTRCGRLFDLNLPVRKDLEDAARDQSGFCSVRHDILFEGICPDCQNKTEAASEIIK